MLLSTNVSLGRTSFLSVMAGFRRCVLGCDDIDCKVATTGFSESCAVVGVRGDEFCRLDSAKVVGVDVGASSTGFHATPFGCTLTLSTTADKNTPKAKSNMNSE